MISIVIPVYNAEKYLERCLSSIKKQTYSNYEIILVNDGSTDNSGKICLEYAKSDSRFIYCEQTNQGPDMSRKAGTLKAGGEYLMFVDADDYIAENMLSVLAEKMEKHKADIVCSNVTRFDDKGKNWCTDNCVKEELICKDSESIFREYFVERHIIGCYYAKLYKAELFKNYSFVKDSLIGEDITGVLQALKKAQKVVLLPDSFYFYYWNLNSISHSKYNRRHRISLDNYIALKEDILKLELVEPKYVCGYFAEFEMAVATAMSRAKVFDKDTAAVLKEDMRKYKKEIKANRGTPLYMKMCISCYIFSPKLFIKLYRFVYLTTGR